MKPKRIILVRHGESQGNAEPGHYETTPDHALHLTETGRKQSRLAGEQIKQLIGNETVRAYVPPWFRTRQTCDEIVAVIGAFVDKVFEDSRLREQEWGHLRKTEEMRGIVQERISNDEEGMTFAKAFS
jgi:broad specificity phosphatase PhoE